MRCTWDVGGRQEDCRSGASWGNPPLFRSKGTTLSTWNSMKTGAWIDATTRNYAWIDGHAHWMDLPAAISTFRLPSETIQDLGKVPWNLSPTRSQRRWLRPWVRA